jgi:formate hydrogenlyase subunit 3/multisubunit Na+/H+ antiporter MnhD subunit
MSAAGVITLCVLVMLALTAWGALSARRSGSGAALYGACAAAALAASLAALAALPAAPVALTLPLGLPWLGLHLRLDSLSAGFLAIVDLGAAAASLYAIGHGRHEPEPARVLPFYPAFLAGMNLVLLADDAYGFLFAWELMSLSSWALVMAHHRDPGTARAGYVYLVMASFGTLALLLGFGVLAGAAGGYGFDAMRAAHPAPWLAGIALGLALLGAGSKAGLAPVHVWLPLAHPAAPSHVSALMSGVMTKVAIYGFIRIAFDLLGPPEWWWSLPVLALGGITAALGVLHALLERDLKRLLACSTIENVGIIFLALGLALAFRANAMAGGAALALTAALFHAANHMLFKSVLFFGSGAVLHATGQRDIERLGGLIHRMPVSAACFLLAAAAISALPPLNGFASEWLIFQAIFVSSDLPQWALKLMVPVAGTLLALAAALVAGTFVRAFGILYLGRPRSPQAQAAQETDKVSLAAMLALCALCVLAGLFPGLLIDGLTPAVRLLSGARMPAQTGAVWLTVVPVADARSSYSGLLIALFIGVVAAGCAWLARRLGGGALRRSPMWDCGYPGLGPLSQYTAASLSQPIRRVLGSVVFRAAERVDMPPPGDMRPARIDKVLHDPAWQAIYAPIGSAVAFVAGRMNHLQFLSIRRYLGMVFALLVALLALLGLLR